MTKEGKLNAGWRAVVFAMEAADRAGELNGGKPIDFADDTAAADLLDAALKARDAGQRLLAEALAEAFTVCADVIDSETAREEAKK